MEVSPRHRQPPSGWVVTACLLLVVVFALIFVGGCGSGAASSSSSSGTATANILTVAQNGGYTTLDPRTSSSEEVFLLGNLYEPLLYKNPAGSAQPFRPALATSWKASPDGKTWTFYLRKGVTFHDGQPFNATAVKDSFDATTKLGQGYAYLLAYIKTIDVVDDYTVKFTTTSSCPLDSLLSSEYGAWIFSPAADNKPTSWFDAGHDAGTGPYMVKSYNPSQQVVLAHYPAYWGGWKANQYKTIAVTIVPDLSTERQELESGQVDYMFQVARDNVAAMQKEPKIHVGITPSYLNYWIYLNTQRKPFNDLRVREALTAATPYDSILQSAGAGLGKVSAGVLPYTLYPHDNSLQPPTYDLAKAKQLLNQAGYPNGFSMTLTYASNEDVYPKIAVLLKASYAKIGVTVNIRPMVWAQAWAKAKGPASGRQDALMVTWWPAYADGYDTLHTAFATEKTPSWNLAYWYNPHYDQVLAQAFAAQAVNPQKAQQLYDQAQQMIVQAAPAVVFFDDVAVAAWSTKLDVNNYALAEAYPQAVFFYDISLR
jgi:peptide/nickel transport system substrate-binding protein